mgnify:CR=1 FL=1
MALGEANQMQSENRLLDDLARIAGGAFSSFSTLKNEAEVRLHEKLEKLLIGMDLVKRDEFDAVKAMAVKARTENAALTKRIQRLEAAQTTKQDAQTSTKRNKAKIKNTQGKKRKAQ